jgi:dTDP-4-dehydrorhamnose reductase
MTQVDQCETEREACWKANVTSVENLIRACAKNNVHLVHVSTDFVFDGTYGPLDETAKPNPVNYYGKSKLAAEELLSKSSIKWSILRTVLVYGITEDMSRSNIVLWVKNSLQKTLPWDATLQRRARRQVYITFRAKTFLLLMILPLRLLTFSSWISR